MANFLSDRIGIRAFSRNVESTFGEDLEATAEFKQFDYEGGPIEQVAGNLYVNSDQVTGSFVPTKTELLHRHIEAQHVGHMTCNLVGMVMGCIAETETSALASGESAIWTKKYHFLSSGLASNYGLANLRSRNLIEAMGDTIKLYKGVVLNGIEFQMQRGNPCKVSVDVNGYNGTATSTKTRKNLKDAATTHPFMTFGDIDFDEGTYTFATEAFSSTVDHKTGLMDFSCTIRKTIKKENLAGGTSGAVDRIDATGVEVICNFKYEIDTVADWFSLWDAQTEKAIKFTALGGVISGAANNTKYQIDIVFPKVKVKSKDVNPEDGKLVRNVELEIIGTPTGEDASSEYALISVTDDEEFYAAT